MSKRITLNDREIEIIIRLLNEHKQSGSAVYVNAWLGLQYINDLIGKLRPIDPQEDRKEDNG